MAVLTIELTEELFAKLKKTERPAQDVIVEALERVLPDTSIEKPLPPQELTKEEAIQRLIAAGLFQPDAWDTPGAQAWQDLPHEKKEQYIREMQAVYLPNSDASISVIRDRKRRETDVPRQEAMRRLRATGMAREACEWDTLAAREWDKLSEKEQQDFIATVTAVYFADSQASQFLIEDAN